MKFQARGNMRSRPGFTLGNKVDPFSLAAQLKGGLAPNAVTHGATLIERARVRGIQRKQDRISVEASVPSGTRRFTGKVLVGADGAGSMVSRFIGNSLRGLTKAVSVRRGDTLQPLKRKESHMGISLLGPLNKVIHEAGIAAGYHVKEDLPAVAPGARLKLTAKDCFARLR